MKYFITKAISQLAATAMAMTVAKWLKAHCISLHSDAKI